MYLSVAHDVILMGSVEDSTTQATSDMWEKMKQFRLHLLQLVFAPTAIALCDGSFLLEKTWKEKFNDMILQWDSCMSQDEVLYPMIQEIIVTIDRTTETEATITAIKNDQHEEEFVTSMSDTTTDMDDNKNMVKQEDEKAIQTANVSLPSSSLETHEIKVGPLEKLKTEPTLQIHDSSDNAIQIKKEEEAAEEPTEDSCVASSPNKKQRITETTAAATEETFGTATIGSIMTSTVDTSVVVDFEKEVC
jgi:hypothetical protein